MSVQAFDLAERLQTPVFVMSDLDIGMNDWMCPELKWDDSYRPDRGKVLSKEEIEGAAEIPSLSRQGRRRHSVSHAARGVAEGRRISPAARVTTSTAGIPRIPPNTRWCSTGWCASSTRRRRSCRHQSSKRRHQRDRSRRRGQHPRRRQRGARHPRQARHSGRLHAHQGVSVHEGSRGVHGVAQTIFVVEQNRDAQLRSLLTLETDVPKSKLRSILHYSGLPMTSKEIVEAVVAEIGDTRQQAKLAQV